jgi:hypothetical protein
MQSSQLLQGLAVYRCSAPMGPIYRVSEPSLCVIANGSKDVLMGKEHYHDDAPKERPFSGARVSLDRAVIRTSSSPRANQRCGPIAPLGR